MPTPSGLPKVGEVWELRYRLPPDWNDNVNRVTVLERGRGDYWSLRVRDSEGKVHLWVDAAYHFSQGHLRHIPKRPDGSGKLLADATEDEILGELRRREWVKAFRGMVRSRWAEARHVIRYAREDLSSLHTGLEAGRAGWEAGTLLELEQVIGSLTALRDYIVRDTASRQNGGE